MELRIDRTSMVNPRDRIAPTKQFQAIVQVLKEYADDFTYSDPRGSVALPFDSEPSRQVAACVREVDISRVKYFVVIGIGGSNLGAKAIIDAMNHHKNEFGDGSKPRIFWVDTTDATMLNELVTFLRDHVKKASELLINIISKSGTTTETIANADVLVQSLTREIASLHSRIIVTTDEDSVLWRYATKLTIRCLAIPKQIGGRYSIFSTVGLFPLSVAGVNTDHLLRGARQMRDACLSEEAEANPAMRSAIVWAHHLKEGRSIADHFFFHPQLETLGKWVRQLMAESLGKETDDGSRRATGILPTVSIGTTDLHSMVQLYLGGPSQSCTAFISSAASAGSPRISTKGIAQLLPFLRGRSIPEIHTATLQGTRAAYAQAKRPFFDVILSAIDEVSIGEFMQWKMMETLFLAELLNVNPFNQPHVETYKKATRELLQKGVK